ncbi:MULTISPECIES: hypothetical protein [Stenotrophomonas]|uniref:hypothetical protein n=1 Tax=Stenotrophomonas TaxID=40323 RepID=UPI0018FEB440|nr:MULTISPECIES: hypothetical protein [Stenotrophomonas]MBN5019675.1 hypothetical protein [Stenotrophomonas maltophilia]MCU0999677.1 hypothetical protein [Stenotrophomonas maltophilia]
MSHEDSCQRERTCLGDGPEAGRSTTAVEQELRVLLILSALMSFASISTDIYLPALPSLVDALHTTAASIELTFSGFLIGFSLGQLIWPFE